jgi:hypothetical protein
MGTKPALDPFQFHLENCLCFLEKTGDFLQNWRLLARDETTWGHDEV